MIQYQIATRPPYCGILNFERSVGDMHPLLTIASTNNIIYFEMTTQNIRHISVTEFRAQDKDIFTSYIFDFGKTDP